MVEIDDVVAEKGDSLTSFEPEFKNIKLDQLANLEQDGVSVHCVNSSDFVVGKQTNFNGPVTIINYEPGSIALGSLNNDEKKEKLVIRDKVLSKSATLRMQEIAVKNKEGEFKNIRKAMDDESTAVFRKVKAILKTPFLLWTILIILIAIAAILTFGIIFSKSEVSDNFVEICASETMTDKICIYDNYSWGERRNLEMIPLINGPVPLVVISQTDDNFCYDYLHCIDLVKTLQKVNATSPNATLCNFLVGGDGNVYEDVGWNRTNSLTGPAAGQSIDICLMGSFPDDEYPTFPQLEATRELIKYGVQKRFIRDNYALVASNAVSQDRHLTSGIYKLIKNWPRFVENIPEKEEDIDAIEEITHTIYSKKDWGGLPAKSAVQMKLPVPYVVISHSVTPQCRNFESCSSLLRRTQEYHFSIEFADIGYNFMVDSSGNIYEGRGWEKRNVAGGFVNSRNIDINFIGDYSKNSRPTDEQFSGVKFLIQIGLKSGKISKNYSLIAANSTFDTLSPGVNVYEEIKNWPHFDPDPKTHVKEYNDW